MHGRHAGVVGRNDELRRGGGMRLGLDVGFGGTVGVLPFIHISRFFFWRITNQHPSCTLSRNAEKLTVPLDVTLLPSVRFSGVDWAASTRRGDPLFVFVRSHYPLGKTGVIPLDK